MTPEPTADTATKPLWICLRGAPARVVAQWLGWTVAAVLAATAVGGASARPASSSEF